MLHQLTRLWISPVLLFLIAVAVAVIAFEMAYQPENVDSAVNYAKEYLPESDLEE